jgi:hypothetical protein
MLIRMFECMHAFPWYTMYAAYLCTNISLPSLEKGPLGCESFVVQERCILQRVPIFLLGSGFADAWLSRSVYAQLHMPVRKPKTISAVIAYYPNQLLMADTLFILKRQADEIHAAYLLPAAKKQLALKGIKAGEPPAMITMIDILTRRGYAYPVKHPGSATQGKVALQSLIKQAQKWSRNQGFGRRFNTKPANVKRLLTDQGTEFKGKDDPNMTQGFLRNRGIKQQFTFEGKSQALSVGERFNKSIKHILRSLMPVNTDGTTRWTGWTDMLDQALDVYNNRYHSTIGTTPNKISSDPESKFHYLKIVERLKENYHRGKGFVQVNYKPGDFVRLRSYNESKKRDSPNWTWRGGPLFQFATEEPNKTRYGSPEMWPGIYMIHKVYKGSGGKSTTYGVWGKFHTEFSGAQGRTGERTINIQGNLFNGLTYPRRAELRRFVAEEIQRVPVQTKKGKQYPDIPYAGTLYHGMSPGFPVRYQDLEYRARNSGKQAAVSFLAWASRL